VLSVTEKVKELAVGRRVSTSKFEVVTEVPGFPTWSVQLAASVIVLLSTSILVVGVKIPLQMVLLSLSMGLICVVIVPVALSRLMSSALVKEEEVTGSGKTTVSHAVWSYKSNGLERVKVASPLVEGSISSII
jgi:hypothetical protein